MTDWYGGTIGCLLNKSCNYHVCENVGRKHVCSLWLRLNYWTLNWAWGMPSKISHSSAHHNYSLYHMSTRYLLISKHCSRNYTVSTYIFWCVDAGEGEAYAIFTISHRGDPPIYRHKSVKNVTIHGGGKTEPIKIKSHFTPWKWIIKIFSLQDWSLLREKLVYRQIFSFGIFNICNLSNLIFAMHKNCG